MKNVASVMLIVVAMATGGAMLAAPGQAQGTARPGEMTSAHVWVDNRARGESLPVTIQDLDAGAKPLRVEITGTPVVTLPPNTTVPVRLSRQPWEYRSMSIPPGQDVGRAFSTAGNDGWEAVSAQVLEGGTTIVLLKRPRA